MQERELKLTSGWLALVCVFVALAVIVLLFVQMLRTEPQPLWMLWILIPAAILWLISLGGFIVNGPNQSRVIQLFGAYVGTLRDVGFFYGNPFYWRTRVSLRVRTFETGMSETKEVKEAHTGRVLSPASSSRKPSKVNDLNGTPIEVAAVVVWKVINSAEAAFQVENYEDFVKIQSEAALRNLASQHPYDGHGEERSLRGNTAWIGDELRKELHERLHQAGVEVTEARISYLAYAPEIAAAMLQRQQAGAMIAARAQIVDAAVGMVEHALAELARREVVELDTERKAAMVSNLMVVLCGHSNPQPVLNAGTLYN
jgi:regulator of protease activity HflC (stomatin/prohibitin superfamily)